MDSLGSTLLLIGRVFLVAGTLFLTGCGGGQLAQRPPVLVFPTSTINGSSPSATAPPDTPKPSALLLTYHGHSQMVLAVAWSPNGSDIASASVDSTVQVWNAATGQQRVSGPWYDPAFEVHAVAWSPDGTRVASASAKRAALTNSSSGLTYLVSLWNASTGDTVQVYTGHTAPITAVAWSPDGTRIAAASDDGTVQVWDAGTGQTLLTYRGHSGPVFTVAWSPDGKEIVSGGQDGTAQVWDSTTGQQLLTYRGHTGAIFIAAWSPDGSRIATGSGDTTVQVWDARTGKSFLTYHGQSSNVVALAWSPDSIRLVSGSTSGSPGAPTSDSIQVWNAVSGQRLLSYADQSGNVNALAWSPDGTCIASAGDDKTVRIWQVPPLS